MKNKIFFLGFLVEGRERPWRLGFGGFFNPRAEALGYGSPGKWKTVNRNIFGMSVSIAQPFTAGFMGNDRTLVCRAFTPFFDKFRYYFFWKGVNALGG